MGAFFANGSHYRIDTIAGTSGEEDRVLVSNSLKIQIDQIPLNVLLSKVCSTLLHCMMDKQTIDYNIQYNKIYFIKN